MCNNTKIDLKENLFEVEDQIQLAHEKQQSLATTIMNTTFEVLTALTMTFTVS
jgi:hypothetical protein